MIWAWERPEDLEFIDPAKFGVAFLSQTITLTGDEVRTDPRRQPLRIPPGTEMMAVTRIETIKPALSGSQRKKAVDLIVKTLGQKNVSTVQVDFDARVSEREFYTALLNDLRKELPPGTRLSMTALASFCLGDQWIAGLPVDEAVPMAFQMGADSAQVKAHLEGGGDFKLPLCQKSYGFGSNEPIKMDIDRSRRVYLFKSEKGPWRKEDLDNSWSLK